MSIKDIFLKKDKRIKERGYIFFDIDGVLNTAANWKIKPYSFRRDLVENLCILAKEENCSLIMISSWRTGFKGSLLEDNLDQIKALEAEVSKYDIIIDAATPIYKGKSRDVEINMFLSRYPRKRYVIIDDDKLEYKETTSRNLFVESAIGFDKIQLEKARKILNS